MGRRFSDAEDGRRFDVESDSAVRVGDVAETDGESVLMRLRLLQQILATDWGSLSPTELAFRNPEVSESTIRDHLREMTQRDRPVAEKLTVPEGKGRRSVPRTFYAVTEHGIELLQSVGGYDGISLLYQLYENVERPDEICAIEEFDHRPEPDWL